VPLLLAAVLRAAACAHAPAADRVSCARGLPGAEAGTPPDLPADRPVGRATLLYRPCAGCGAWLVTEQGARYTVPPLPAPPPVTYPAPGTTPLRQPLPRFTPDVITQVWLSPGGRWLARSGYGGVVIRDL